MTSGGSAVGKVPTAREHKQQTTELNIDLTTQCSLLASYLASYLAS